MLLNFTALPILFSFINDKKPDKAGDVECRKNSSFVIFFTLKKKTYLTLVVKVVPLLSQRSTSVQIFSKKNLSYVDSTFFLILPERKFLCLKEGKYLRFHCVNTRTIQTSLIINNNTIQISFWIK